MVFVDTTCLFDRSIRLPLIVCAQLEALTVAWSPYVAAELGRVATRNYVRSALAAPPQGPLPDTIEHAMESVRTTIDAVVAQLEQVWSSPAPGVLRRLPGGATWRSAIQDREDLPILCGALATSAKYLLSHDRHFSHGQAVNGVEFWHPDTFLTALFELDEDLYVDVRLDLMDLFEELRTLPDLRPQRSPG